MKDLTLIGIDGPHGSGMPAKVAVLRPHPDAILMAAVRKIYWQARTPRA